LNKENYKYRGKTKLVCYNMVKWELITMFVHNPNKILNIGPIRLQPRRKKEIAPEQSFFW